MKYEYELWGLVSLGHGEPRTPLTLIDRSDSFEDIYAKFKKTVESEPCAIFVTKNEVKYNNKIYESPDGGTTIHERNFVDYNEKHRRRVK